MERGAKTNSSAQTSPHGAVHQRRLKANSYLVVELSLSAAGIRAFIDGLGSLDRPDIGRNNDVVLGQGKHDVAQVG